MLVFYDAAGSSLYHKDDKQWKAAISKHIQKMAAIRVGELLQAASDPSMHTGVHTALKASACF